MKKEFIEAGKIINTHGIKGEVKIQPWVDSAEFLKTFKTIYIAGEPRKVSQSRVHKGCLIVKLQGLDDINDAIPLKNKVVSIKKSDAKLPEGAFFLEEIMGAKVMSVDGEELGTLSDIIELPAHNVYVVKGEREIMIPAVEEFIINTDVENGTVTVKLIEGM